MGDHVYAEIHYSDDSGPQTYFVTQNEVSVGRGGEDFWVDLPLYASDQVSREHLRLRRDPASGAFTIRDQSRNGTWLNGRRLTTAPKTPLPDRAEIRVAEVITPSSLRGAQASRQLYNLHIPFVIAFLAFVVLFVLAHLREGPRAMSSPWFPAPLPIPACCASATKTAIWMDAERGVFLVVDGVGGQAAGELAAQTAVEAIRETIFWHGRRRRARERWRSPRQQSHLSSGRSRTKTSRAWLAC